MILPQSKTIGRLAPSPTGGLHVGHARTFLLAWLSARSQGGEIALRVEDLDATRTRANAAESALSDLAWLGLDWDRGPVYQSERMPCYSAALEQLKASELVYPCICTRAEIARAASAPHEEDEGPNYAGTCAHHHASDADALGDRPFTWRFRVSQETISWNDRFQGTLAIDPSRIGGDFLVARQGVGPSYQLAVVVDDAAMGITEVIRGADLIPSTPRQMLLSRALGLPLPTFGHVGLVVGPDGKRLAKREGSIKLSTLRESGVDPRRLIGTLARSLGLSRGVVSSHPQEWIDVYPTARVIADGWAWSTDHMLTL